MSKKYDFELKVSQTIGVTKENIDDIMCTALEGGITSWCWKCEVVGDYLGEFASEQISRGGTLKLYDSEEDEKYWLTLDKLLNGIKLAYEGGYYADYDWCNGRELDCCQVDAEVADAIVQLALFGDVIYG